MWYQFLTVPFLPLMNVKSLFSQEDNKVNQMVAQRLLNNLRCTVDVACNGVEAITLLERSNEYDIIFMDCHMPVCKLLFLSSRGNFFDASFLVCNFNLFSPGLLCS